MAEPTILDFQRLGVGGSAWMPGTRWLSGLTDSEIDGVERQWGLRFTDDSRLFLRKMHAPDRLMFEAYYQGNTRVEGAAPSFFNWLEDCDAIRAALRRPAEGLAFDFAHNDLWFDEWGSRPSDEEEAALRFEALTKAAPQLVPVLGHRYIVEADVPNGYVVLSVHQSDIIVYASNLRDLLLSDLGKLVGQPDGRRPGSVSEVEYRAAMRIPFWGRFIE